MRKVKKKEAKERADNANWGAFENEEERPDEKEN